MRIQDEESLMVRIAMRGPVANARMHAMLAIDKENENRQDRVRIQQSQIDYIRQAVNAPDVLQFLAVV
jgi:hypothetical protein